jgi:hypothetical protein
MAGYRTPRQRPRPPGRSGGACLAKPAVVSLPVRCAVNPFARSRSLRPALARALFALVLILAPACGEEGPITPEPTDGWLRLPADSVTVQYREPDAALAPRFADHARAGHRAVASFFGEPFPRRYVLRLYPNRALLTPFWRLHWRQPTLEPACWMVGSADASMVVLLSPNAWAAEACGHDPADSRHMQAIVTHEQVHALHWQVRPQGAPNWLMEGLAGFVAGQFDDGSRAAVRDLVARGGGPQRLEDAWAGEGGYSVSASLIDYIDVTYGRATTRQLLRLSGDAAVASHLGLTEEAFLERWRAFVRAY